MRKLRPDRAGDLSMVMHQWQNWALNLILPLPFEEQPVQCLCPGTSVRTNKSRYPSHTWGGGQAMLQGQMGSREGPEEKKVGVPVSLGKCSDEHCSFQESRSLLPFVSVRERCRFGMEILLYPEHLRQGYQPNLAVTGRMQVKRPLHQVLSLSSFLCLRSNNIQAGACFSGRSCSEMFLE